MKKSDDFFFFKYRKYNIPGDILVTLVCQPAARFSGEIETWKWECFHGRLIVMCEERRQVMRLWLENGCQSGVAGSMIMIMALLGAHTLINLILRTTFEVGVVIVSKIQNHKWGCHLPTDLLDSGALQWLPWDGNGCLHNQDCLRSLSPECRGDTEFILGETPWKQYLYSTFRSKVFGGWFIFNFIYI